MGHGSEAMLRGRQGVVVVQTGGSSAPGVFGGRVQACSAAARVPCSTGVAAWVLCTAACKELSWEKAVRRLVVRRGGALELACPICASCESFGFGGGSEA